MAAGWERGVAVAPVTQLHPCLFAPAHSHKAFTVWLEGATARRPQEIEQGRLASQRARKHTTHTHTHTQKHTHTHTHTHTHSNGNIFSLLQEKYIVSLSETSLPTSE